MADLTMPAELKPCPFCRSDNVSLGLNDTAYTFWVGCDDCFAIGPHGADKTPQENLDAAVEGWNRVWDWIDEDEPQGGPVFWKAGGGPGTPVVYGYGYWTGPDGDLLCLADNLDSAWQASALLSPMVRWKWLAYLLFKIGRWIHRVR